MAKLEPRALPVRWHLIRTIAKSGRAGTIGDTTVLRATVEAPAERQNAK